MKDLFLDAICAFVDAICEKSVYEKNKKGWTQRSPSNHNHSFILILLPTRILAIRACPSCILLEDTI